MVIGILSTTHRQQERPGSSRWTVPTVRARLVVVAPAIERQQAAQQTRLASLSWENGRPRQEQRNIEFATFLARAKQKILKKFNHTVEGRICSTVPGIASRRLVLHARQAGSWSKCRLARANFDVSFVFGPCMHPTEHNELASDGLTLRRKDWPGCSCGLPSRANAAAPEPAQQRRVVDLLHESGSNSAAIKCRRRCTFPRRHLLGLSRARQAVRRPCRAEAPSRPASKRPTASTATRRSPRRCGGRTFPSPSPSSSRHSPPITPRSSP